MNIPNEKIAEQLRKLTLQELIVEVIENGRAKFIASVADLEPIPLGLLLEEGSRRSGQKIDSADAFFDAFLESDAPDLDDENKAVLKHAVKIKAIERRFLSDENRD